MTLSMQLLQIPEASIVERREFYLQDDSCEIGSGYDCDICLPDPSETMSATHLVISRTEDGAFAIMDTSQHGTALNEDLLPKNDAVYLNDGDVLGFCGYKVLIGIVGAIERQQEFESAPVLEFRAETDLGSDGPLLSHVPSESTQALQSREFHQEQAGNDLLFDPFDDGLDSNADQNSMREDRPRQAPFRGFEPRGSSAEAPAGWHAWQCKNGISSALERALDRFLAQVDPEAQEREYDELVPLFANRKKHYWQFYKRQFSKKRQNREFYLTFFALLDEEIGKL